MCSGVCFLQKLAFGDLFIAVSTGRNGIVENLEEQARNLDSFLQKVEKTVKVFTLGDSIFLKSLK